MKHLNPMVEPNAKIFGKLKYREAKLPSTALEIEKNKNMQALIKEKRQARKLTEYPFISPSKLMFFKSHYTHKRPETGGGTMQIP